MTKKSLTNAETRKRVLLVEDSGALFNAARWYAFIYGCAGTGFYLVLYLLALQNRFYELGVSKNLVLILFGFHALAGVLTFQPQGLRKWRPLFAATPWRATATRWLFGLSSLQFAVFLIVFVACGNERQGLRTWLVPVILTSFLLQNTVYIACHWALRPESFLPKRLIEAFTNPLGFVASLFH